MKELILSLLAYLPSYFIDIGKSLLEPKRFGASVAAGGSASLQNAFVFSGLTIVLATLLQTSFLGRTDLWDKVILFGSYTIISAGLAGALSYLSWRLVGARKHETPYFSVYLFQFFTLTLIGVIVDLTGRGFAAIVDPEFYRVWQLSVAKGAALPPNSLHNLSFQIYLAVEGAGLIIGLIWQVIAWGAFRDLFGVSRPRSAVAFILCLSLCVPCLIVMGGVLKGLSTQ